MFSGRQGLATIVDAIGGEEEVRRWLEDERKLAKDLPIIERKPDRDEGWSGSIFSQARSFAFATLGLDPGAKTLPEALLRSSGAVGGLVSLWQPPFGGAAR